MSFHMKVGTDGRLELPADILERAGFRPGEPLSIHDDGEGGLVIKSKRQMIQEAQSRLRSLLPAGVSLVDELIAERRAEAAVEDAEDREWARARNLG